MLWDTGNEAQQQGAHPRDHPAIRAPPPRALHCTALHPPSTGSTIQVGSPVSSAVKPCGVSVCVCGGGGGAHGEE